MRPIPLLVLNDTITVEAKDESDRRKESWLDPVTYGRVRCQHGCAEAVKEWALDSSPDGWLVFVDARNSTMSKEGGPPLPVECPRLHARVTLPDGSQARVTAVRACHDANSLHHWEVTCS